MWLTQTYLHPNFGAFPLNLYVLFNKYTNWNSQQIAHLRQTLLTLGRMTSSKMAGFMPGEDIDKKNIGDDMDAHFSPLIHRKLGQEEIDLGIFVCNRPLIDVSSDGSNCRWVFVRYDKELNGPVSIEILARLIEEAADAEDDHIQHLVRGILDKRRFGKNF